MEQLKGTESLVDIKNRSDPAAAVPLPKQVSGPESAFAPATHRTRLNPGERNRRALRNCGARAHLPPQNP